MARMPIIRARGQQELTPMPRANAGALDIGGAVAGFGASVSGLADELSRQKAANEAKDREHALRSARVEAITRMGQARAASDAERDVDGLSDRFDVNANSIIDEIAGRFEGDDHEEFRLIGSEIAAPHRIAVFGREAALRGEIDRDRLSADVNALITEYGRTSDPTVREGLLDQAGSIVERAYSTGLISEEKKRETLETIAGQATAGDVALWLREDQERGLEFLKSGGGDYGPAKRQELIGQFERELEKQKTSGAKEVVAEERARIRKLIDEDPAVALDQIDAGAFATLKDTDPESWQMFRNSARAAMETRRAQEIKAADDERAAELTALDARITNAERNFEEGLPISGELISELIDAAEGGPYAHRVAALEDDRAAMAAFRLALPAEREQELKRLSGLPGLDDADRRRRRRFFTVHENLREREERDPLGHFAEMGGNLPRIDLGDPDSLQWRAALASDLAGKYEVAPRFFSDAERDEVLARFRAATPDDQVSMLGSMDEALGPAAALPLSELEVAEPLLAQAGHVVSATGRKDAARLMLAGRQMMAEKTAAKIPDELRQLGEMASRLREALPIGDLGVGLRGRLLAAADAIFVATVTGDPSFEDSLFRGTARDLAGADDPLVRAYTSALNMAAGATLGPDQRPIKGGFQNVNGRTVLLPASIGAEQLRIAFREAPDDAMAAASVSGQMPFHGDEPLRREDRRDLVAVLAGRDDRGRALYRLGIDRHGDGGFEALLDPAMPGGVALFDLEALTRWRGQP